MTNSFISFSVVPSDLESEVKPSHNLILLKFVIIIMMHSFYSAPSALSISISSQVFILLLFLYAVVYEMS